MFQRQLIHVLALGVLLSGVVALARGDVLVGQLFGMPTVAWLALAIAMPIVHQTYVWLMWRLELYHGLISRRFGRERGFRLFATGFSILFTSRIVSLFLLAASNFRTLDIPHSLQIVVTLALALLAIYTYHSVFTYLGIPRTYGVDHFDPAYREIPFVRKGVFRYTSNAIYTFGFALMWIPGVSLRSEAALLAALFNHLYIWVHYYCAELPDIARIYGPAPADPPA